jgi:hypothetical protein
VTGPAPVPARAAGAEERPGDRGWLEWLGDHLDRSWRPAEWDQQRWLFTGDLGSDRTAAWPCATPGCPVATRYHHRRCDGCRRARLAAGSGWEEFDAAPFRRPIRPLARGTAGTTPAPRPWMAPAHHKHRHVGGGPADDQAEGEQDQAGQHRAAQRHPVGQGPGQGDTDQAGQQERTEHPAVKAEVAQVSADNREHGRDGKGLERDERDREHETDRQRPAFGGPHAARRRRRRRGARRLICTHSALTLYSLRRA